MVKASGRADGKGLPTRDRKRHRSNIDHEEVMMKAAHRSVTFAFLLTLANILGLSSSRSARSPCTTGFKEADFSGRTSQAVSNRGSSAVKLPLLYLIVTVAITTERRSL